MSDRGMTSKDLTEGFIFGGDATEALESFRAVDRTAAGGCEYADSGWPTGLTVQPAAIGDRVSAKRDGYVYMGLKGQAVNIAHGDPIKLTTDGFGVKAATDKDKVMATLEDTTTVTTDLVIALVHLDYFTLSV